MWTQTCRGMFETPKHKLAGLYDKACILLEAPDNIKKSIQILANDIDTDIVDAFALSFHEYNSEQIKKNIIKSIFGSEVSINIDNKYYLFLFEQENELAIAEIK